MRPVYIIGGIVTDTFRITSTNAAQAFTSAQYRKNNIPAIRARISGEVNDIRYALGSATPTQGATGLGHILAADADLGPSEVILNNPQQIQSFSFLSHTNNVHGGIQVTMEFEVGTDLT